jgi:hypothetical protein
MCNNCIEILTGDIEPIVDSLIARHATGSDQWRAGVEAAANEVELWAKSLEENQQPALLVESVRTLARCCRALLPAGERPAIDVTQQHDFVLIVGSDHCGLRGCTFGVLEHAWIPAGLDSDQGDSGI